MLKLTEFTAAGAEAGGTLTLTFDQRQRSRLRTRLDDGREAAILLARGRTLRDSDFLTGEDGVVVRVRAAPENISTVRTGDLLLLARACYHLGNRHVPLQIEPGELRYLHDPVLDEMIRSLGLQVSGESAGFEPEPGAYGPHGDHHGHAG